MKASHVITLILLSVVCSAHAGTVLLIDGSHNILRPSVSPAPATHAASTAALCAASGLVPPYNVDPEASKQVEGIVQQNVFNKPKALVLLHIAGLSPESSSVNKLQEALGGGTAVQLDVQDSSDGPASAGSMLQATSDVVSANPDVPVTVLDHSALKGCHPSTCMANHLSTAAHHCGGKMHGQQQNQNKRGGLAGSLALPGLDTPLDLSQPAARLFGLELAGLQGATQQVVEAAQQKQQQDPVGDEDLAVYESTFVGLQGLAALYPPGAAELAAAEAALTALLGKVAQQLKELHGDEILYQVSLLGAAPVSSSEPSHLMDWKEVSRRVLLQRTGVTLLAVGADETAGSKSFANKATAYAVALILIWFTFAGVYCMVSMKFKQDSLLYGRSKAD